METKLVINYVPFKKSFDRLITFPANELAGNGYS